MWLRATTSAFEWAGPAGLDRFEEVLHVVGRGNAFLGELPLLGAEPAGGELQPAAVARLDPAVLAFVANGTAAQPHPAGGPHHELQAVIVGGDAAGLGRSVPKLEVRRRCWAELVRDPFSPWGRRRRRRSARKARAVFHRCCRPSCTGRRCGHPFEDAAAVKIEEASPAAVDILP